MQTTNDNLSYAAQLDALLAAEVAKSEPTVETTPQEQEEEVPAEEVESEIESYEDGVAEQAMALERGLDSAGEDHDLCPPAQELVVKETKAQKIHRLELNHAVLGLVSTEKLVHGTMVLNGIAEKCVCCGMPLTDAVSIERAMGPNCSARGYAEDPQDPDEMSAMIELAEYPALVEFLTKHYRPLGVRGLMNGLVRIAALNRRTRVHSVCCNAIELLGYKKLANTVRNALCIGQIQDSKTNPGHHHLWIKKAYWTYSFGRECGRLPQTYFSKPEKGWIIPKRVDARKALWEILVKNFPGESIKTPSGPVRIPTLKEIQDRKK